MTESPGVSMPTASVRRRIAAHLIDALLVGLASFVVAALASAVIGPAVSVATDTDGSARITLDSARLLIQAGAATALSGAYFVGTWIGPWAATAGQRALGVSVVRSATPGDRLGVGRALLRWILLGAPFGLVAALVVDSAVAWSVVVLVAAAWTATLLASALRDGERRGLHDRLVGSRVVKSAQAPRGVESGQ